MISKVNKSNSEVTNYTFDIENKLVAITSPGKTIEYIYDGLNRRIGKVVNGVKTSYIYDGDDIIFEFGDSDQLVRTYTHGAGVDEHLSVHTQANNTELYYHSDGLGSVTELTDQTGQVVESYLYSAFGVMKAYDNAGTEITIDNVNQPYGYTGRELDKETDLYYYRARYYSSSAGRFVSEDPIGFQAGDANLFRYVGNNPINENDSYGLDYRICQRNLQGRDSSALFGIFVNVLVHRYIEFDDGSIISVGQNDRGTFGNINEAQVPQVGRKCGNFIQSTPEEDQLMKRYASQNLEQEYNVLTNSCKDFTRDVIYNFRDAR